MNNILEMYQAVSGNDAATVRALIANNAALRDYDIAGTTWLHMAAEEGHIDTVACLIELGCDVNSEIAMNTIRPTYSAASNGHSAAIELLHQHGAQFDQSYSSVDPLFTAIYNRHIDTVKTLIKLGIDTTVVSTWPDGSKVNPILFADMYGGDEILALLKSI